MSEKTQLRTYLARRVAAENGLELVETKVRSAYALREPANGRCRPIGKMKNLTAEKFADIVTTFACALASVKA